MNVQRSVARELYALEASRKPQEPGSLAPLRERPIAPVVGLGRFHDTFDQFPQRGAGTMKTLREERSAPNGFSATARANLAVLGARDGFDRGSPAPVNLSGRGPAAISVTQVRSSAEPRAATAFSASLDDLASL